MDKDDEMIALSRRRVALTKRAMALLRILHPELAVHECISVMLSIAQPAGGAVARARSGRENLLCST
jgi:hypothetical protein